MKRFISLFLIIVSLLLCVLPSLALECNHSYIREFVSATCTEKGHTKYTCQRCGDTYNVYDDEYTAPEGFYILAESTREDSTLTVDINIVNNPGLVAARLKMHYNGTTLSPREVIVGNVWSRNEFTGGIKTNTNPLTFFVESNASQRIHNYNDGTFVTVVFDIVDANGSYGIGFSHAKADFVGWDYDTNTTVVKTPTIVNVVGKNELGSHLYEETIVPPSCSAEGYTLHRCSFCGDSYTDSFVETIEHNMEFTETLTQPDFTNEGIDLYTCTECGYTEERTTPVLEHWMKGDLNNDTRVNAMDSNLLTRILVGRVPTLQQIDAADLNNDGKLNAQDSYLLHRSIGGQ